MLRSAINNATLMAAARRSLAPSSAAKASLSTLSFNSSSIDDMCRNSGNHTYTPVASTSDSFATNIIQSTICNLVANLSGDATLVSLEQTQSQIEENKWGGDASLDLFVLKEEEESLLSLSVWLISTLKRRKKMMNKHKLRKRRKKLRLKTRK
mmetsp:Transcript_22485/g.45277  ORF Transcript_22485/g.45277 Transcript_22485/m.45277 type:complete len:153 (+) Transcript_22485:196-654(+)